MGRREGNTFIDCCCHCHWSAQWCLLTVDLVAQSIPAVVTLFVGRSVGRSTVAAPAACLINLALIVRLLLHLFSLLTNMGQAGGWWRRPFHTRVCIGNLLQSHCFIAAGHYSAATCQFMNIQVYVCMFAICVCVCVCILTATKYCEK